MYPALVLVGAIAFEFMVAGEDICLDRHPWWGPPEIVTHGGSAGDACAPREAWRLAF